MLAQSITGRSAKDSELDQAIARSCWGVVAGGVDVQTAKRGGLLSLIADSGSASWASENLDLASQPVCDAKSTEKEEGGEEEEEGDEFEDDDEDDEDEEFEGEDEFEDDDDEFFDGDDDDDEFDDDVDDEDDEDEDF